MKTFRAHIFLFSLLMTGLLAFVSGLAAFAIDEGNEVGRVVFVLAKLFYVFFFPFDLIISVFVKDISDYIFLGIITDCFFYALIIERLFYLRRKKKKVIDTPSL